MAGNPHASTSQVLGLQGYDAIPSFCKIFYCTLLIPLTRSSNWILLITQENYNWVKSAEAQDILLGQEPVGMGKKCLYRVHEK